MIIPSKHSGYQAGIRLYPGGGGGGGGAPAETAPSAPPPPPPNRMASAAPPPMFQTYGQGDRTGSMVQSGNSYRPSNLDYSKPIYDPNYADNITGYQQSSQFYQPVYSPSYQNYNTGNSMNVSQYGQQPFTPQRSAPFNPYTNSSGGGGGFGGGFGGFMPQMQSFFNYGGQQQPQQPTQQMMSNLQNAPQASGNQPALQQSYSGQEALNMGLGGSGSGGFMSQMQSPFSFQQQQVPYASQPPQGNNFSEMQRQYAQPGQDYRSVTQPNYGPSQSIYSRSTQGRGTPNVRRYAEGGIASLMDDVE